MTTHPNTLLSLTADHPSKVLTHLQSHPSLASHQDTHGYSLLHAAASYNHLELLKALVQTYHVDVNLRDEDGDTCLFVAESLEVVRCLVEELGVDVGQTNEEGVTALERMREEEVDEGILKYLEGRDGADSGQSGNGEETNAAAGLAPSEGEGEEIRHPPPLPPNMTMNFGTMEEQPAVAEGEDWAPDPEFRRRIDELAASDRFNSEEGQQELRDIITDAVHDVGASQGRDTRRRLD